MISMRPHDLYIIEYRPKIYESLKVTIIAGFVDTDVSRIITKNFFTFFRSYYKFMFGAICY